MEELKHFSHDKHPLILIQVEQNNISHEPNCYGCGEPILEEPTYNCHECNIFLHKRCAELPMERMHPLHAEHPLKLVAQPPRVKCYVCKCYDSKFTYYCIYCEFGVDILCAEERITEHPSHQHPLTMVRRMANFECDACGSGSIYDRYVSYMCTKCGFWIHKHCSLLPSIYKRKDHPHPLSLSYSFPIQYRKYKIPCDVCFRDDFPRWNWVYYCGPCRHFVHLDCIRKSKWGREFYTAKTEFLYFHNVPEVKVKLPTTNFVSLIKDVMEKQHVKEIQQFSMMKAEPHEHPLVQQFSKMKVEPHEHPLNLFHLNNDQNSINQEMVCNRCTEPIISSCYHCTSCQYSIHLTCSQLPKQLKHPTHKDHALDLTFHPNMWGTIKCTLCKLDCNGGIYHCSDCDFDLNIKCALLPDKIFHEAHDHPLRQSFVYSHTRCNGCGTSKSLTYGEYTFVCERHCRFYLCYACASLPRSVKHRWDKHELLLSFPPFSDQPDEFYCEICEEEIHPTCWQYRCGECDQSFHPSCVAESRNIIFGQTVKVSEHQHPITSVPEGDLRSHCNSCHVSLYGKRTFKCASCRYHKCFTCMP